MNLEIWMLSDHCEFAKDGLRFCESGHNVIVANSERVACELANPDANADRAYQHDAGSRWSSMGSQSSPRACRAAHAASAHVEV